MPNTTITDAELGEPHDMLATAFETAGGFCDHVGDAAESACSDCLADIAIDTIERYIADGGTWPAEPLRTR